MCFLKKIENLDLKIEFIGELIVNRAAFYVRHQTGAAYWEETQGQTVGGMARDADNNVLVIIHASCIGEYIPKPDDRIANGISKSEQPPSDALTVTSVKRFPSARPAPLPAISAADN